MAEFTVADFVRYISKQVKDPYGRLVGKIAAFISDTLSHVKAVVLERGDGEYNSYSTEYVTVENDIIKVLSELKVEAGKLIKELELAWKKSMALEELLEKKEVPQEVYEHFQSQFNVTLKELKSRATEIIDKIKARILELDSQIRVLQMASASVKISYRIGEIDEAYFNSIMNMIQTGMNRIVSEKKDLEVSVTDLEKLLATPPTLPKASKEETSKTLVVHIKE
ncbi:MAG: CdvA-like protein [Candidatus Nezhaarchaeales archaeon]